MKYNKVKATFKSKIARPIISVEVNVPPGENILTWVEEDLKRMGLGSIFHPTYAYKATVSVTVKEWPHGGWSEGMERLGSEIGLTRG